MSDLIIRVSELSKKFHLGSNFADSSRLAEVVLQALSSPFQKLLSKNEPSQSNQEFWALRDLSFDVTEGEIVGVIGKNGAGKSTLLKILSRITDPTSGCADLFGRVGSILEVGVGFHGELSGRENIFLNGAVLGMKRREIARKFDEIVQFADIGQFLDTPIKRYSSGMYVRLAFAVAAFLEPEILIVDEVLAVGDVEFQKKCIGKMNDVARSGRTVIFVSHNVGAMRQLCQRMLVMSHGTLIADTDTEKAIDIYLTSCANIQDSERQWGEPNKSSKLWPVSLQMLDQEYQLKTNFASHQSLTLELLLDIFEPVTCQITFSIVNSQHICIFSTEATKHPSPYSSGRYHMRFTLPGSLLAPDLYKVALCIHNGYGEIYFVEDHALSPVIEDTSKHLPRHYKMRPGVIYMNLPWEISKES